MAVVVVLVGAGAGIGGEDEDEKRMRVTGSSWACNQKGHSGTTRRLYTHSSTSTGTDTDKG